MTCAKLELMRLVLAIGIGLILAGCSHPETTAAAKTPDPSPKVDTSRAKIGDLQDAEVYPTADGGAIVAGHVESFVGPMVFFRVSGNHIYRLTDSTGEIPQASTKPSSLEFLKTQAATRRAKGLQSDLDNQPTPQDATSEN